MDYIEKINERQDIFGDEIAYVEQWDFSRSNLNEESRIEAITKVASVCYANPNVVGKESLYNRLKAESKGLPSSSFEFVPVLLSLDQYDLIKNAANDYCDHYDDYRYQLKIMKYGEVVYDLFLNDQYLLTNYRALLADYEELKDFLSEDITQYFNTKEECDIIEKHFKVFLSKLDIPTRTQYIRHRVNWQELSRRYVSGKKVGFEFYISKGMKTIKTKTSIFKNKFLGWFKKEYSTEDIVDICVKHYFSALDAGVQPQEARRILPQAAYTTVWSAWQPSQLKNFFDLRLDKHAQWEIQQFAKAKQNMILEVLNEGD